MTEKILFVDDEPRILEAYRRTLRKSFSIDVAEGGHQALEKIKADGPYPVIVSDMQMPEMNGVEFLSKVKALYPDTIRIMLTGNADQHTAVEAINTSDVFCFLNKPCPPDKMIEVLTSAVDAFKRQNIEKELLEKTVKGSIVTLVEVLSLAKPRVFGRVESIRKFALATAKAMDAQNLWEVETLSLLSQIGLISLPDKMVEKALSGMPLTDEEQEAYQQYTHVGANILSKIPRLESVALAIGHLEESGNAASDDSTPLSSRIVKPVVDMINAQARDLTLEEAFSLIKGGNNSYDQEVIDALGSIVNKVVEGRIIEINLIQLEEGMELAGDIRTHSGALLVEKGQRVNASMVARLVNFARSGEINEKALVRERVSVKQADSAA